MGLRMAFPDHPPKAAPSCGTDEFDRVIGQPPASRDVVVLVLPHTEPFVVFFEFDSVSEFSDSFRHFGIVYAPCACRLDWDQ